MIYVPRSVGQGVMKKVGILSADANGGGFALVSAVTHSTVKVMADHNNGSLTTTLATDSLLADGTLHCSHGALLGPLGLFVQALLAFVAFTSLIGEYPGGGALTRKLPAVARPGVKNWTQWDLFAVKLGVKKIYILQNLGSKRSVEYSTSSKPFFRALPKLGGQQDLRKLLVQN